MEDEEIQLQQTDPKKIAAQKRAAALKARKDAREKRDALLASKKAQIIQANEEKVKARAEAMATRRAQIEAKRNEGLEARQAKIDKLQGDKNMETEYNAIEKKRRSTATESQQKEDNYDWTYVDGDKDTANKRQRTEIIEGEKEVERIIKGTKEVNTFEPTGNTDADVYNADPSLKKKYPTLKSFRIAAQQFRDDQVKTVETEEKVIEKVPTREEKVITQTREDWIKKQSWADGLPAGMVGSLARSMRKRGEDMTPQQLYDLFKSQASEKESAAWARKNGFGYLLGGRGSRGSSTTSGKTNFN
jgi:Asp-tRNA(Asn)/Glu-tRNA(Gln) amidotransferase C subunit